MNKALENFIVDKVIADTIKESKRRGVNVVEVRYSDLIKALAIYLHELDTKLVINCEPVTVMDFPQLLNDYLSKKMMIRHLRVKENTCKEFAEMINTRTDAIRVECIKRGRIFKTTYIVFHVLKHETDIDIRKSLLELLRKTNTKYYECVLKNLKR